MAESLHSSLKRMKTSYFDLYFVHAVSNVADEINGETKAWAEKAKREGKIRFFGFSTHANMAQCMLDGAKLGWLDGIMASYNYRLMHTDAMKRALDACVKAGIGVTAMKTQAPFFAHFYAEIGRENDGAKKLTERFMEGGFTPEQAKLKAVWENPRIASICSHMPSITILQANAAAAMDERKLSLQDRQRLNRYAAETSFGYCTGCAKLCESAVKEDVPVGDVMRSLMYYYGYGNYEQAALLFNNMPGIPRNRLIHVDYGEAERLCPQNIPIATCMKQAVKALAKKRGDDPKVV